MEIKDFSNYLIYPEGKVWVKEGTRGKRFLKVFYNKGYEYVTLINTNGRKHFQIHRLVAIAFIPNPNNYQIVNHKDNNPTNNNVDNLEWCTNIYNNQSIRKGINFGCVYQHIEGPWVFEFKEWGNRYFTLFKTKEEAEIYREVTKQFYIELVLN
jgi:hypothetical protein